MEGLENIFSKNIDSCCFDVKWKVDLTSIKLQGSLSAKTMGWFKEKNTDTEAMILF